MRFESGVLPLASADLARQSRIANHLGRMRVVEFLIAYVAFLICERKSIRKGKVGGGEEEEAKVRREKGSHPFTKGGMFVVEEKRESKHEKLKRNV